MLSVDGERRLDLTRTQVLPGAVPVGAAAGRLVAAARRFGAELAAELLAKGAVELMPQSGAQDHGLAAAGEGTPASDEPGAPATKDGSR